MVGASIPSILGNMTGWKHTMLAWLPFSLPHENVYVCGDRVLSVTHLVFVDGCWSSINLWIEKEILSVCMSGVCLGMTCKTDQTPVTSPGRCRFTKMAWTRCKPHSAAGTRSQLCVLVRCWVFSWHCWSSMALELSQCEVTKAEVWAQLKNSIVLKV